MSGNTPNNFQFSSFTGTYLRINALTTYNSQTSQLCSSSATLCPDAGLPGTVCTDRSTSLGVWCNASTIYPYIASITSSDCTNDNSNDYHLNKCPTTGATLTISGLYFDQTGSTIKNVKVGGVACPYTSWTTTQIVCTLPAGIGANHIVDVTANNGISNTQTRKKLVSYTPPTITTISPNPGDTEGIQTTFTGTNFGTTSSTITIKFNNVACTGVTWVSNTEVRATTPAGSGANHPVVINVGGQDSTSAPAFSYKTPAISKVSPTLGGGDLIFTGTDFANAAVTIEITDTQTNQVTTCPSPTRNSYTEVKCTFTEGGQAGTCLQKNVTITISSLKSNSVQICYKGVGEANLPTAQQVTEGSTYKYTITLTEAPESTNVPLAITSSDTRCAISPSSLTFTSANYSSGFEITINIADNYVDEGTNANSFTCTLTHTISSSDPIYASTNAKSFTITAINNDNADFKLQLPKQDNSDGFEYKLKVVGPLAITEGTNTSYGLILDTQPTQNVIVHPSITYPRTNTPLIVTLYPSILTFTSSNWNTPQSIILSASGDSIDNDIDVESFQVLYYVKTSDTIFVSKATNNTVITQISDDDTAGIKTEGDNVIALTEGSGNKTFTIKQLTSKPLHDVTITITSSSSSLIEATPSSITISKSNWDSINQKVTVKALDGDYSSGTTFTITLSCTSTDPKYNTASTNINQAVTVATVGPLKGELVVPESGQSSEGSTYTYLVKLSMAPADTSKSITVGITSSDNNKCTLSTSSIVLTNGNYENGISISVTLLDNTIDEGTDQTSFTCTLIHTVTATTDTYYTGIGSKTLTLSSVNNDNADFKLQLPKQDNSDGFEYKLKVVGPLAITEGTNTSYGLILDTQPTQNVIVHPSITYPRTNTPLIVTLYPSILTFTSSNWNTPQSIILSASGDSIDNDIDVESFQVLYYVKTSDTIFVSKATNNTVITQISDDDTAGIVLENDDLVQLEEGGIAQSFTINGLLSQPLHDVTISIVPSSNLVQVNPASFTIAKTSWQNINQGITAQAIDSNYAAGTTFTISIQSTSIDPKYANQMASKSVVVATNDAAAGILGMPTEGFVSEGGIYQYKLRLTTPPKNLNVNIKLNSLNDKCKIDVMPNAFTSATYNTPQNIRILVNDDFKFYAKESVSYICEIQHRIESQDEFYKNIEAINFDLHITSTGCGLGEYLGVYDRGNNGTECICSPQHFLPPNSDCKVCPIEKAVCTELGLKAPHVAANWWRFEPSSPDLIKYPFYRCPLPNTCHGGNNTQSRCVEGHNGPVCATCKLNYVMQGKRCVFCDGRESASTFSGELLSIALGGLVLFMVGTLYYITQPALSKTDITDLRKDLKEMELGSTINLEKEQLGRAAFKIVMSKRSSLTAQQLDQAFDLVDISKDGTIDVHDWEKFTKAEIKKGFDKKNFQIEDIGEDAINKVTTQLEDTADDVKRLWGKLKPTIHQLGLFCISMQEIHVELTSHKDAIEQILNKVEDIIKSSRDKIMKEYMSILQDIQTALNKMKHVLHEIFRLHLNTSNTFELKSLVIPLLFELQQEVSAHIPQYILSINRLLKFDFNFHDANLQIQLKDIDTTALKATIQSIQVKARQLKDVLNNVTIQVSTFQPLESFDLGGWLMKLKIFVGFAQCFAYFPVTFDIPWSTNMLAFMKAMEFTAFDLYAVFGDVSCRIQTGFLQKFVFHMALFPAILAVIAGVYVVAGMLRCVTKCCRLTKFTAESLKTQVLTLLSLVSFTLYTGIATRIFRLYKCRKIQDTWYLTADYSVKCQQGEWNGYAGGGVVFIILYVIGIPGIQLYLLVRNRKHLHLHDEMSHEDKVKQRLVEKEYGSIYNNYTEECYYYDILDLFRRLLLTGGLIMMGEESIAQIFLGIIISFAWVSLLFYKRPYKAAWDNVVAIILSAHLLLTLVSGMALKLYDVTPGQDEYQIAGFDFMLIFVSVLCVVLGLLSIVASTPCLRDLVTGWIQKWKIKNEATDVMDIVDDEKVKNGDVELDVMKEKSNDVVTEMIEDIDSVNSQAIDVVVDEDDDDAKISMKEKSTVDKRAAI